MKAKEWARSYVTNESKGRYGWLVKRANRFIGFATCAHEGEECEIVLNGVVPSAAGAGVYGDLIKFIQRFFKDRGCSNMKVSTQIYNYRVQKVWSRVGVIMEKAFLTLHINCFMSVSRVEKKIFGVTISADDIARYSRMSDDMNRLHFDKDYDSSKGFGGRMANEFLINAII